MIGQEKGPGLGQVREGAGERGEQDFADREGAGRASCRSVPLESVREGPQSHSWAAGQGQATGAWDVR